MRRLIIFLLMMTISCFASAKRNKSECDGRAPALDIYKAIAIAEQKLLTEIEYSGKEFFLSGVQLQCDIEEQKPVLVWSIIFSNGYGSITYLYKVLMTGDIISKPIPRGLYS